MVDTVKTPLPVLLAPSRPPLEHMRIAVSYYCSLRCQHCYVPELNRKKYRTLLESSQLTLDEIHAFINLLIEKSGLKKVSVTGGEALFGVVWPRARSVLRHALDRGMLVQLNTSGSGQIGMQEVAEVCQDDVGRLLVQLSLDGINEEKVDHFRGRKGAMRRALVTLRDATRLGIAVQVRYTMTEDNWDDAVACYDLASEMGARNFHIKPMFAAGKARDNQEILIRSREKVRAVQLELIDRSIGRETHLGLPEPVYVAESEFPADANVYVIKCQCGGGAGYLSTNGDVYPCTYLVGAPHDKRWVLGNICDPGFDFVAAWNRPDTYAQFRYGPKDGYCTAQTVVSEGLGMELGPVEAQCG